jgi:hypothetical protein
MIDQAELSIEIEKEEIAINGVESSSEPDVFIKKIKPKITEESESMKNLILTDMQKIATNIQSQLKDFIKKVEMKMNKEKDKWTHEWRSVDALPMGEQCRDGLLGLIKSESTVIIVGGPSMIKRAKEGIADLNIIHQLTPDTGLSVQQYEAFSNFEKWMDIAEIKKNYQVLLQKECERNPGLLRLVEENRKIREQALAAERLRIQNEEAKKRAEVEARLQAEARLKQAVVQPTQKKETDSTRRKKGRCVIM